MLYSGNMRLKRRMLVSLFISVVPSNTARVVLHRVINRYKIAPGARIGMFTILACDQATIGRATIGMFNRFLGPFSLELEDGVTTGWFNLFECLFDITDSRFSAFGFKRACTIGKNVSVGENHFIDATDGFYVGEGSWIAGRDSQFWTHGAFGSGPVAIGSMCYVGSAVRFSPGAGVGNHCLVALGSVVTKRFDNEYLTVGGVPARVINEEHDWTTGGPGDKRESP